MNVEKRSRKIVEEFNSVEERKENGHGVRIFEPSEQE